MKLLGVEKKNTEVKKNTEAKLACTITEITAAMKITWSNLADGHVTDEFNAGTGSQTSTLTVKPGAVTADKTYTCTVSSVQNPTSEETKFEVELLVYGKCHYML
jgi:hypothetical protein